MSEYNSYESKAKMDSLLGTSDAMAAEKNLKETLIQTATSVLLGGLAGSFAGQLIGKSSLLIGIGVTGLSYYGGSDLGVKFGIGMMAAGYVATPKTQVNGIDGVKERVKERSKMFGESLKARLFLDSLIKPKTDEATNGLGNVRYLVYPSEQIGTSALDMSALNSINKQVAESAKTFSQNQQKPSSIEISGIPQGRII